jgi:hypothetical protein
MSWSAAAALALTFVAAGCGAHAHAEEIHVRGDVRAVSVQSDTVGWLDWRPTDLPAVWARDLHTGRVRRLETSSAALGDLDEAKLVLAGSWAGWAIRDLTGNESSDAIGLAAVGRSRTVLSAVYEVDPLGISYGVGVPPALSRTSPRRSSLPPATGSSRSCRRGAVRSSSHASATGIRSHASLFQSLGRRGSAFRVRCSPSATIAESSSARCPPDRSFSCSAVRTGRSRSRADVQLRGTLVASF